MKYFVIILTVLLFIMGCTKPYYMHNSYIQYVKEYQLDSICDAENIPQVGDKWVKGFILHENGKNGIRQYSYIKNTKTNTHNIEIVYICIDLDSMYRISKRLKTQEK